MEALEAIMTRRSTSTEVLFAYGAGRVYNAAIIPAVAGKIYCHNRPEPV